MPSLTRKNRPRIWDQIESKIVWSAFYDTKRMFAKAHGDALNARPERRQTEPDPERLEGNGFSINLSNGFWLTRTRYIGTPGHRSITLVAVSISEDARNSTSMEYGLLDTVST